MKITHESNENLTGSLTVIIDKSDVQQVVDEKIIEYKKKAKIPGFRKGHVPKSLIEKQYGRSILAEEVDKLVRQELSKYLENEKLEIFGLPMLNDKNEIDWSSDKYLFNFNLGFIPKIDLKWNKRKSFLVYKVCMNDDELKEYLIGLKKQFGKITNCKIVAQATQVSLIYSFLGKEDLKKKIEIPDNQQSNREIILLDSIKSNAESKKLLESKKGDFIELNIENIFKENEKVNEIFKQRNQEEKAYIYISDAWKVVEAEYNQEFFDKVTGIKGQISTLNDLKGFIKDKYSMNFELYTRNLFVNEVLEALVRDTKFKLPEEFLTKWLDKMKKEGNNGFQSQEKQIRFQLIEEAIIKEFQIQIHDDEIKEKAKEYVLGMMQQYGDNANLEDTKLEEMTNMLLKQDKDKERFKSEVKRDKIFLALKDNLKTKPVSIEKDKWMSIVEEKKRSLKL